MRTRHSLISLVLVISLLLAPASLAAPSLDAGFGWFSQVKAFVVDVFGYLGFGDSEPTEPATIKPQISNVCEGGAYPEPSGCP